MTRLVGRYATEQGISLDGAGTGAAFFVNGIFQEIELFDRESTFGK